MTDEKNPLDEAVEQAIDAFVFAPLGLLLDGPAKFPDLVRNGKNQVTNARMMGQFTVQMGRAEAVKRASTLDGPLRDVLQGLGVVPRRPAKQARTTAAPAAAEPEPSSTAQAASKKTATKKTTAKKTTAKKSTAKKATKKRAAPKAPSVASLPIPDYDSLSASQVASRLGGLTPGDLRAVASYESAKRARKTVLGRVEQLLNR